VLCDGTESFTLCRFIPICWLQFWSESGALHGDLHVFLLASRLYSLNIYRIETCFDQGLYRRMNRSLSGNLAVSEAITRKCVSTQEQVRCVSFSDLCVGRGLPVLAVPYAHRKRTLEEEVPVLGLMLSQRWLAFRRDRSLPSQLGLVFDPEDGRDMFLPNVEPYNPNGRALQE
jgi:hypothetical protein